MSAYEPVPVLCLCCTLTALCRVVDALASQDLNNAAGAGDTATATTDTANSLNYVDKFKFGELFRCLGAATSTLFSTHPPPISSLHALFRAVPRSTQSRRFSAPTPPSTPCMHAMYMDAMYMYSAWTPMHGHPGASSC